MTSGREIEDWRALEAHPIAALMPAIGPKDFQSLVESMEAVGFLPDHPILLFQGKILDGRSRHAAAIKAGRTPVFREFSGEDPLAYAFSANMARRHLTASQKAFAIAGLAEYCQRHLKGQAYRKFSHFLADKANVSARSVERAIEVRKKGSPRLHEAVVAGKIRLGKAETIARQESRAQDRIVAAEALGALRGGGGRPGVEGPVRPDALPVPEVPVTGCDSLIALYPFGDAAVPPVAGITAFVRGWARRWRDSGATWVVFGWRNGPDLAQVLGHLADGLGSGYVFEHLMAWDFSHPANGSHSTGLRVGFQPLLLFRAAGAPVTASAMPKDLRRLTLLPDQDLFQYPLEEGAYGRSGKGRDALLPIRRPPTEVLRFVLAPFCGKGQRVVGCWTSQGLLDEAGKGLGAELIGVG